MSVGLSGYGVVDRVLEEGGRVKGSREGICEGKRFIYVYLREKKDMGGSEVCYLCVIRIVIWDN